MKKKVARHHAVRHHHAQAKTGRPNETYLVVVRSWMLVVMVALMLGVGLVAGSFIAKQLDEANPAVAGVQTAR
jgi:hypothetical protein